MSLPTSLGVDDECAVGIVLPWGGPSTVHPLLVSSLDNMARRLRDGYRYRMVAGTCPSCTCRRCDPRFPIIRLRRNGSATVGVSKSESWSRGVIWDDEGSSTS